MSDFKFSTEPFLDSDQAAAILRIHPKTLQRLARHGRVIGYPDDDERVWTGDAGVEEGSQWEGCHDGAQAVEGERLKCRFSYWE
jgi:hypothetical protein